MEAREARNAAISLHTTTFLTFHLSFLFLTSNLLYGGKKWKSKQGRWTFQIWKKSS